MLLYIHFKELETKYVLAPTLIGHVPPTVPRTGELIFSHGVRGRVTEVMHDYDNHTVDVYVTVRT